jgi:aspartyl-tRNA(Asn)/glutamyl-tRNA(Gln) amidotransferase subunit A
MNTYRSLKAIQQALQAGEISCLSLTQSYLTRIQEQHKLNAFLEVFEDEALSAAQSIDDKLKAGMAGRLAGMVIGIKDNICYQGHQVSAASKILNNFESMFSATVVERLLAEDAIIIGRLNCDEFAMGSTNENSAFEPVLNPINTNHVPGGSSGGSAAAVAADLCLASLGSDTGGSIRQPASFCGVMGYKPTYGRVSRWGLIAYASSFDQIGPFTHNASDAALIMEVISGSDEHDSTCSEKPVPHYSQLIDSNTSHTIGFIKDTLESPSLDPEVKAHLLEQIEQLKDSGHKVVELSFPYLNYVVPTYYVLTTAEASSNLARFDGVHFGHRTSVAEDIPSTYANSRTEGFGEEVQRRIMLGTFVLSAGYYDAYYTKAQKVRRLLLDKTLAIFESCDFILSPTSPHTALEIGKTYDDPTQLYLEDIFTVHANIVGIPAVSLPTGTHSNGLPFGIQLMAPAFKDDELLAISNQIMNMQ